MSWRRHVRLAALAVAIALVTSGCFLRLAFGAVVVDLSEHLDRFFALLRANASGAACSERDVFDEAMGWHTVVECDYVFENEEFPSFPKTTSTATLIREFGLFGVFIDPVILQVPEGASTFDATFREAGGPERPLELTATTTFLAAPGRAVTAEPGQQFLILELPDDVAERLPEGDPRVVGVEFDFALSFEVPELSPVEVKPMFTLAVPVDDVTYYPPMLPCVTDFAEVPSFEIPVAHDGHLQDLSLQVGVAFANAADAVCDGEVYDFTAIDPPPDEPPPPGDDEDPIAPDIVIDVKPGSDRNPVNPHSRGVLPVAVLTTSTVAGDTSDFDATTIDPATARLGRGATPPAHAHLEDVDGDGALDLMLHFPTPAADVRCGDTDVTLVATTNDGRDVTGTDSIVTVPCDAAPPNGPGPR